MEDGYLLIDSWRRRARESFGFGSVFEAFIFIWIAFNGWAERVTGLEQDRQWIQAVGASARVRDDFDVFLKSNPDAAQNAANLAAFGPVFRASRQRDVPAPRSLDRRRRVEHWLRLGIPYRPSCYEMHGGGRLHQTE
jgi:hypothetical protein